MEEKKLPWYRRLHRLGQTNLTEDDPAACDLEFWKAYWKETDVQGVIINCGGIVAYYPSHVGLQAKAAGLAGRDTFGEFAGAAREQGLAVIARMDISCADEELYRQHPGWFVRDRAGRPVLFHGRYASCVNSGYYKEYVPAVLEEVIARYHPEGFADNSWKGLGRSVICYCENCREQFRQECGMGLPEKVDWNDGAYREWIRWSYRCRTRNWDLFNSVTQKAGGEDCLWIGMIHADPFGASGGFLDIRELCKRSPIIFSDHQTRDERNGFEQNALNGNLLHMAAGEEVTVLESMAHYHKGGRTFRLSSAAPREVTAWMQAGAAGGVSPWFHHVSGHLYDKRQFRLTTSMFHWHRKNEGYLYGRKNLANVGVLWSQENIDFYGRDDYTEKTAYPWAGFCKALSRAGIPFVPVHIDDLEQYEKRLDTVVLPNLALLTEAQQGSLCRWLERGKHMVLTGECGAVGDSGRYLAESPLLKRLGIRRLEERTGAFGKQAPGWENFEAHNYLELPPKRHPMLKGFEETELLPFGGGIYLVESSGPLEPVCTYVPAFPIYPPEFSWIRERRRDISPIYAGTLASGSRVAYFSGDIDRCYGKYGAPDHGALLSGSVDWAAGGKLVARVAGPGHINLNVYDQPGCVVVHLVNLSGADMPQGTLWEALPTGPVTVTLERLWRLEDRAVLTVAGGGVPVAVQGEQAVFTIDSLAEHEMAVINKM